MLNMKSLFMFTFLLKKKMEKFYIKITQMQMVDNSFWRIGSSSFIDIFTKREVGN